MEEETTNAVLKEMVIGLTKLTDERFKNIKEGIDNIQLLMRGFVTRTELEEVKKDFNATIMRIEQNFAEHGKADVISFGGLKKGQEDLSGTVKTWAGGMAVVIFLIGILLPIMFHYVFKW